MGFALEKGKRDGMNLRENSRKIGIETVENGKESIVK